MKDFYIHCDGGFGNRFNSLIVGMAIALEGNFNPVVSWPSTNVCRALFDDIFDIDINFISKRLEDYSQVINEYEFLMHENQLLWNVPIKSPYDFRSIQDIINFCNNSDRKNIFYFNNLIPNYKDSNLIYSIIKKIKFRKEYYNILQQFLPPYEFIGVHLRSTDFPEFDKKNFDLIFNEIENSDRKYFVCSDDFELENKFNQLKNVFVYPKTNYVKKIEPNKNWCIKKGSIKDERGKSLSYNVERDNDSVKQAILDLLILSKSDIMETSNSTFLNTAVLLKKYH